MANPAPVWRRSNSAAAARRRIGAAIDAHGFEIAGGMGCVPAAWTSRTFRCPVDGVRIAANARFQAMRFGTEAMRRWLTALFVLLLAGCTTLPPRIAQPASSAIADTGVTPLGRIAAASLADAPGGDSGFRLLPSGEMAFDARLALAEAATRSIDAQYYHIHDDTAGAAFLAALRDAAVRGVRVRLLVDDYHAGDLYPMLRGLAAFPNAEVRLFNPLPERYGTPIRRMLLSLHEFTRVNRRMHNKLFVADNQFAVYGGRNIADEYFTRHGEANFIDLDVLSAGAVVRELSASFDRYWNSEQVWALEQRLHALERAVKPAERRADFDVRLKELAGPPPNVPPRDYLGQSTVRAQIAQGRLQTAGRQCPRARRPARQGAPTRGPEQGQPGDARQARRDRRRARGSGRRQSLLPAWPGGPAHDGRGPKARHACADRHQLARLHRRTSGVPRLLTLPPRDAAAGRAAVRVRSRPGAAVEHLRGLRQIHAAPARQGGGRGSAVDGGGFGQPRSSLGDAEYRIGRHHRLRGAHAASARAAARRCLRQHVPAAAWRRRRRSNGMCATTTARQRCGAKSRTRAYG